MISFFADAVSLSRFGSCVRRRKRLSFSANWAAISCLLLALPTNAAAASERNFAEYTPRIAAVQIDGSDAPVIDGDLSDPSWSRATAIDEFYQVLPLEGVEPSQPTRAYIMYDKKHLYVAVHAYDSEPRLIRRSQMGRDPAIDDDDAIRIMLDSNGTFRDSFYFAVNPNGARADALSENNGATFRDEWNSIWRADARVVEDGWIAEFAIPFQSISFDPSIEDWNLQIIRTIRRENEEIRWANIDRSRGRLDFTNPGRLSGIENIRTGAGLEAQIFATGQGTYDWPTGDTDFNLDPSANLFYKITPSLTGSLTLNTDFSDTPLDARQVNTGRFSLFFPETRDFFLQDSAVFEFGGRVFGNFNNGLPFFSRNIGIVNNQPVDLIAGVKLSGKIGRANVGVISAYTGEADIIGLDNQLLTAGRISLPVLDESRIGLIFTHGDPTGTVSSTTAGADFQFKKSNVFGEGTLVVDAAYVSTINDGAYDAMVGLESAYRSETWNGTLMARHIGRRYAPRLGFLNRSGIRRYYVDAWRTLRPPSGFIRSMDMGLWTDIITGTDNSRLDQIVGAWTSINSNAGDNFEFTYKRGFSDIRTPFLIAGEVLVPNGEYRWNEFLLNLQTTNSRWIGAGLRLRRSGIYGGDHTEIVSSLNLRPSRRLEFSAAHTISNFDLALGKITIHISALNSTIAFSPDMILKTEIQYDNISEAFTWLSRFDWEPTPGREVFLSFGHTADIERTEFPQSFTSQGTSLSLRLGYTLRL